MAEAWKCISIPGGEDTEIPDEENESDLGWAAPMHVACLLCSVHCCV